MVTLFAPDLRPPLQGLHSPCVGFIGALSPVLRVGGRCLVILLSVLLVAEELGVHL
jgi:hypothetical protein